MPLNNELAAARGEAAAAEENVMWQLTGQVIDNLADMQAALAIVSTSPDASRACCCHKLLLLLLLSYVAAAAAVAVVCCYCCCCHKLLLLLLLLLLFCIQWQSRLVLKLRKLCISLSSTSPDCCDQPVAAAAVAALYTVSMNKHEQDYDILAGMRATPISVGQLSTC